MDKTRRWLTPRLFLGGFLIFLGVWLVLMNLDVIESVPLWRYWPMVFIVLGIYKLIQGETSKEKREGFWFAVIGTWLQASFFGLFGLGFSDSWPILVIAWGISVIWESFDKRPHATITQEAYNGN